MRAIINGSIVGEERIIKDHILIFGEKIEKIIPISRLGEIDKYEMIDAKGAYLIPGLIDLHIHGTGGFDTMDGSFEVLDTISDVLAKEGVTSFLPTTMTMEKEDIRRAINNIRESKGKVKGAKILGCHMEGPFISREFKGAQDEKNIVEPCEDLVEEFQDIIKIVTMAPEEDYNHRFIKKYKNSDLILAMGHTNATFQQGISAVRDGIGYATHTFNAMRGFHHREPGTVGAVFASDIYCELIGDMIHVHKDFFETFIKINGIDKVLLVSDCMRAGAMEKGIYDLGGQKVYVDEKSARLEDGRLAGSILKLKDAIKNLKNNTSYEFHNIVKMATLNSARAIGKEKEIGSLSLGKRADIVLMDSNFDIIHTIIEGRSVFER